MRVRNSVRTPPCVLLYIYFTYSEPLGHLTLRQTIPALKGRLITGEQF